jgi:hypothetical protein
VARGLETIRIPRLQAVVVALASLVIIGFLVFLQRYRGADRTAMALSLLMGGGLCLVAALIWFQGRFRGMVMTRRRLWGIGLRYGAIAGVFAGGVGTVLLAVRWAIDQQAGPAGDLFLPAFLPALISLGLRMATGFPAYLAVGAVVGALAGVAVAEAIGISAERLPSPALSPIDRGATPPLPDRDVTGP